MDVWRNFRPDAGQRQRDWERLPGARPLTDRAGTVTLTEAARPTVTLIPRGFGKE